MPYEIQLVASPNINVSLNGIVQANVVAFNTRAGWIKTVQKSGDGEWVTAEFSGVVSASCDFTTQTTQALGSGEGTNSISS